MRNVNDFEVPFDLKESMGEQEFVEIHVGDVNLPTGKIIAADPFYTDEQAPFARTVEPDKYPVYIFMAEVERQQHRVAYAKIKFMPQDATRWILALTEGLSDEELNQLGDDEFYGFPVESGLACFLDEETSEALSKKIDEVQEADEEANYYDEVLGEEFRNYSGKNSFSRELGDWNDHHPDKDSDNNAVMFASGWGEGYYPAYWGFDEEGNTVELVVDFLLNEFDADDSDEDEDYLE